MTTNDSFYNLEDLDRPRSWPGAGAAIALLVALGLALALRARPLLAALYLNLGAAQQARAELALFDAERAQETTLDQVRRRVDLSNVRAHYTRVLALDPGHAQAQTRLAQIALSRGDYARALEHAQAAWQAGHDDWRTRLTLGDALVAEGRVDEGAEIVRGLPRAEARLETWGYYRHTLNGEYRRAADAFRAVVLLNPDNERAARFLEQAEERARGY